MNAEWTDYWDIEECPTCDKQTKRLETAQEFFEGIIEMLSKKEPYNKEKLETYFEEVGGALGIKVNIYNLNLQEAI